MTKRAVMPPGDRKKKASGENIPEAQRHTVQVKLRLSPESAAVLRERAETAGETVSATVERLLAG